MGTYVCMTLLYGEESQIVHACTYKQVYTYGDLVYNLHVCNSLHYLPLPNSDCVYIM